MSDTTITQTPVSVETVTQILGKNLGEDGGYAAYNASVAEKVVSAIATDPQVAERVEREVYFAYMDAVAARTVAAEVAALVG